MFRGLSRPLLCVAAAASTPSPDVLQVAKEQENKLDDLSPRKIADILDRYIIGQADAKKAVSISLRNRWRRRQLKDESLQKEVVPKNMLLVGPTGVGKTEISRRMARITDAPFIKVEATKYTEVGFKGKDVESIIEDLYTNAKTKAKKALEAERHEEAMRMALDTLYSAWNARHGSSYTLRRMAAEEEAARAASAGDATSESNQASATDASSASAGRKRSADAAAAADDAEEDESANASGSTAAGVTLDYFREHYETEFKDDLVTVQVTSPQSQQAKQSPMSLDLSVGMLLGLGGEPKKARTAVTKRVVDALPLAIQEALDKLVDENSVNTLARTLAEEDGVVFIDEIDKVVAEQNSASGDVSSIGVQQDLLPLVEGSNVTLKDGSTIATDNILFICSGAFHVTKTADMIAELQGRLPVRVELKALTEEDFRRILTEPKYNLLNQQCEMMKTENIAVTFTDDGVKALAKVTCQVNTQGQNIGARRLYTIIERVMDEYSFNCDKYAGQAVDVDAKKVHEATEKLLKNVNLAKYLL